MGWRSERARARGRRETREQQQQRQRRRSDEEKKRNIAAAANAKTGAGDRVSQRGTRLRSGASAQRRYGGRVGISPRSRGATVERLLRSISRPLSRPRRLPPLLLDRNRDRDRAACCVTCPPCSSALVVLVVCVTPKCRPPTPRKSRCSASTRSPRRRSARICGRSSTPTAATCPRPSPITSTRRRLCQARCSCR